MHLNKDGTVMISTIIILALISTLGTFLFKMMKNNNELSYMNNINGDIYDLEEKEEKVLKIFMNDLNNIKDKEEGIFDESFKKNLSDGTSNDTIEYDKEKDELLLITHKNEQHVRTRKINYISKNEKIILIPTYDFQDKKDKN